MQVEKHTIIGNRGWEILDEVLDDFPCRSDGLSIGRGGIAVLNSSICGREGIHTRGTHFLGLVVLFLIEILAGRSVSGDGEDKDGMRVR